MKRSILRLEQFFDGSFMDNFRTVIKTKHGRILFLSLRFEDAKYSILECFYLDRNQGRMGQALRRAEPKKLETFQFPKEKLLDVIETELDKKFYGTEYILNETARLPLDEYLGLKVKGINRKYRFLIMVGEGECRNGLPMRLRTRLKNRLHRSIYVELSYYKDGQGAVEQCCYYDRQYKRQDITITPPMLTTRLLPYSRPATLYSLHHETSCDFTHILVTDGIDLDSNTTPLCGAV